MTLRVGSPRRCFLPLLGLYAVLNASLVGGQRPDSAAAGARATSVVQRRDSLRPPLSPRRAFLYSAVLPGYSQSVLGRHRAAALMLFVEAISVAMINESAAELREARRMRGDTLVTSYVDLSTGAVLSAPTKRPRRFDDAFVRTRESHLEDWIAFLIGNHLFSAADAFVAANLWDVPGQLSVRATPSGASIGARFSW